ALRAGKLEEAWGTGTAAVVSPIGRLMYNDEEFVINGEKIGEVTQKLYDILTGIQWGTVEDEYNWIHKL
ncbi:MAG: branched chain amino acid aminotransferase, partial [Clostridia bacterium]|nr:branched chain amino acid aminotransferase [Clostridia bacterium]